MIREINLYSLNSKFAIIHPMEKLVLVLISLVGCTYVSNIYLIVANIFLFIILNLIAKNPFSIVKKFIGIVSLFFIFTAIILLFQGNSAQYILLLITRVINGALSIAFLALTTPINHLVSIMGKYEYLRDIGDIVRSMERFLMVIEDDFKITFNAMKSRAGFSGFKNNIRGFGLALGVSFRNLMIRWREVSLAMKNRCYVGRFNYNYSFNISKKGIIGIIIYFILMTIFCIKL